ncbi:MAG TPA: acyl-CoA thioesterase [Bacteroidales bacterium]|nr:acyl-CoA thioesterase [Bacteroidales bacterium]
MRSFSTYRLVKSEDLNHHGTLYAGRSAEWFVESGFVAASSLLPAKNIICLKIHGMSFLHPVRPGQTICFESRVVFTGKSSLRVYTKVYLGNQPEVLYVEGFITFIHVDENTKPKPHGLEIVPETEEEIKLYELAKNV